MRAVSKVLCPVDFSPWSAEAMRYAAFLCRATGAELTLLHVFEMPAYASLPPGQSSVASASVEESIRRVCAELETELERAASGLDAGRPIHKLLRDGVPAPTILEVAAELDSGLIVMGTQGRTGLSRLLLGSVAERVLRAGQFPVLTVPSRVG